MIKLDKLDVGKDGHVLGLIYDNGNIFWREGVTAQLKIGTGWKPMDGLQAEDVAICTNGMIFARGLDE